MIATTGAKLLPPDAVRELRTSLLPRTTVLTPNIPEARLILAEAGLEDRPVASVDDLEVIGRAIHGLGPRWVLVKGGHCPFTKNGVTATTDDEKEIVVDVLCGSDEVIRVETPYLNSSNTHGTGCSLACQSTTLHFREPPSCDRLCEMDRLILVLAAIASNLAKGMDVPQAVRSACRYVEAGIKTAPGLGGGNGPLNHFHSTFTLPFAPSV